MPGLSGTLICCVVLKNYVFRILFRFGKERKRNKVKHESECQPERAPALAAKCAVPAMKWLPVAAKHTGVLYRKISPQ